MKYSIVVIVLITLSTISCTQKKQEKEKTNRYFTFEVKGLSNQEYPDNPDIGYRSIKFADDFFKSGKLVAEPDGKYTFIFYSSPNYKDSIVFKDLDLSQLIPSVPIYTKNNAYLSELAVVNQEWNRNQLRFDTTEFHSNDSAFVRADIARNCLNAGAWEVILYNREGGKELPIYHGWFNFPKEVYAQLFQDKNKVAYSKYKKELENWIEPKSEFIDTNLLATNIKEEKIKYFDLSNQMYPLEGARKKKRKDIVIPAKFNTMKDLQTDSTEFSTFDFPGLYRRSHPRPTELGRFYQLVKVKFYKTLSPIEKDTLYKIDMTFNDKNSKRTTHLVMGGLNLNQFPFLEDSLANKGWKNSMGFGNHPFYETYSQNLAWHSESNPYYAYLSDDEGKWLDSHNIGIDGPLFYFDATHKNELNIWLLSFERQAFVGHYKIVI